MVNPYGVFLGEHEPAAVLAKTPERLAEMIAKLTPEQLNSHPIEGKWSIAQQIAHMADVELVMATRSRWIAFEDQPRLAAFDQDKWIAGWEREGESAESALERFRVLRESLLRFLNACGPEDLERKGIHSERGELRLADIISTLAGHDLNHLQQVEKLRGLVGASTAGV